MIGIVGLQTEFICKIGVAFSIIMISEDTNYNIIIVGALGDDSTFCRYVETQKNYEKSLKITFHNYSLSSNQLKIT